MKHIEGIPVEFQLTSYAKVSDLIYYDGPLLSHFVNANDDNLLFFWVDTDNIVNRWMVIRVSLLSIQKYTKKKITLLELLRSSLDGTILFIELNSEIECVNAICTSSLKIPEEYLPSSDSYYTFRQDLETDNYLRLKQFDKSSLEIHLTGYNVGYGEMHYDDFVSVNQRVFSLWERLSVKYLANLCENYKADNMKRSVPKKIQEEFRKIMQMDYSYAMAGSVRIILTPRDKTKDICPSGTDCFIQEFANILECGNDIDCIRAYTDKYGPEVLYEYKELVDMSCNKQLNIGVTHYCKADETFRSVSINEHNKTIISRNLSSEISEEEQVELVGHFYSINTKRFKYGFTGVGENGDYSDGSFAPIIQHLVASLTFTKLYKVRIIRNVKQKMTKRDRNYDKMIDITVIPEHKE